MKKDFINVLMTFGIVLVVVAGGSAVYNKDAIAQMLSGTEVAENNSTQNNVVDQSKIELEAQQAADALAAQQAADAAAAKLAAQKAAQQQAAADAAAAKKASRQSRAS